jgi:hypothetical protein
MLQISDNRRRFVMPKGAPIGPGTPADVELLADGRVMITPLITTPVHEQWAHTQESLAQTAAALKDYNEGRTIDPAALNSMIEAELRKRGERWLMEKVQTRTEQQLREAKGIHLEPIKSQPPFLSIRLDKGPRAKVLIEGDKMIFVDINTDHDEFYWKNQLKK